MEHARRFAHDSLKQRAEIELRRDVRHQVEELELLDPLLLHLLDVLAVHEGNGRLRGHRLEQLEIVVGELARALVEHLGDADDRAPCGAHRRAHDAPRLVTRLLIDGAVEVGMRIGVGHDNAFATLEHAPGDAGVVRQSDLTRPLTLRDPRVELGRGRVVEEQGASLGIGLARGQRHQARQHLVERLHGRNRARDVDQRLGEAEALRLLDERVGLRISRCHCVSPASCAMPRWSS